MNSEIYLQNHISIFNATLTLFLMVLSFSSIYIFLYENSMKSFLIFIGFIFIGFSLKFIDDAFDINSFDKKFAFFLSFPTGVIMGALTFFDFYSAIIFISLVFALFLIGKIDNIAFKIVFLIFLPFTINFLYSFSLIFSFNFIPVGILFFACILDEKLNEFGEKKNTILAKIFYYRPAMKISVFVLCFFVFPFFYFFAFLSFDFAYCFAESLGVKNERI